MTAPLLEVRDLRTHFFNEDGVTRAVDGLSFAVAPQETVGIVGDSGCGATVTALSILQLLPPRLGRIIGGRILFEGTDLTRLSEAQLREVRGNRIGMI
ncbi:MAG TPA: ATP-binding cassette domain-containing protein, partial [Hyphomicrobiaceae bacterium]|nr:ATP-binding cassette domain-containing protein [Hyphomicrobiaceae bacterium]